MPDLGLTERLKDFPPKAVLSLLDIVYVGDQSEDYNEVYSSISEIFATNGALAILGGAARGANSDITSLGALAGTNAIRFADDAWIVSPNADTKTLIIGGRDVDGASDVAFITITSGNTPTCDLSSSVTIGGISIARGGDNTNILSMSGLTGDIGNSIQKIVHSPNPAISQTGTGLSSSNIAGENLVPGDILYLKQSDSRLYKADNTDPTKLPALYLCNETVTTGNSFKYIELGFYADSGFSLTVGGLIYLSTSGDIIQIAPSSGIVQILGVAISATVWYFSPQFPAVYQPVNAQTGTTYTLASFDNGRNLTLSNASTITLTLPQQSTTVTPSGYTNFVQNIGAGTATIVKEGSETLTGNNTLLSGASAIIKRTSTTNWTVFGGSAVTNMFGSNTIIQTITTSETYVLSYQVGVACTLLGVGQQCRALTTAGTFAIQKNGVTLSGLGTIVPSTGGSYTTATGTGSDNLLARGDKITIVADGTLLAVLGLAITLDFTQTF